MATPSKRSVKKSVKKTASGNKSAKAGLIFPVGRISSKLRKGRYAKRVSATSGAYLAAVLEYLTSELLENSSKFVIAAKKNTRITPRAMLLAVRADKDLNALFSNVTLSKGGVVPAGKAAKKVKKGKKGSKSA